MEQQKELDPKDPKQAMQLLFQMVETAQLNKAQWLIVDTAMKTVSDAVMKSLDIK